MMALLAPSERSVKPGTTAAEGVRSGGDDRDHAASEVRLWPESGHRSGSRPRRERRGYFATSPILLREPEPLASSVLQPARLIHPERDSRTGAMRVNLLPYPLHLVAARDDRFARTEAVVGVALLHPVGSEKGDAEGTVGIGADDRLVVRRHRPGEGLLGAGVGRRRSAPGNPPVLSLHQQRHLDVAHGRRTVRAHAGMMGVAAEDDDLAFARPSAPEIGNRILRACRRCGTDNGQYESTISHEISFLRCRHQRIRKLLRRLESCRLGARSLAYEFRNSKHSPPRG